VGFEITITRLLGKWKVSQNRTDAERQGVTAGLREREDPGSAAMADLVDRLKR
jgi:transcriptional regulator